MNYHFKTLPLVFLVLLLCVSSCMNDDLQILEPNNDPHSEIEINPPQIEIMTNVYGKVLCEEAKPLSNIKVTVENHEAITDENGFFYFKDIVINGYGTLISAVEVGYYQGFKIVQTDNQSTSSYVEFRLVEKKLTKKISSNEKSTVEFESSTKVDFQANGFVDSFGNKYEGEVYVYAKWFPTDAKSLQRIPGDLRAANRMSEIVQLTTYGMLVVELETPNGEQLNLAPGKEAELSFEVPDELVVNSPQTIPMWYFDDSTGYWIEQGDAELLDGMYIGYVSHFSWWSSCIQYELIDVKGQIVSNSGNGLANLRISYSVNSKGSGEVYTDSRGYYKCLMPKNQIIDVVIYDSCGDVLIEQSIGPHTEDTTLDAISADEDKNNLNFTGKFVGCDGSPVQLGFLQLNLEHHNLVIPIDTTGRFDQTINACNYNTIEVQAFDFINSIQSEVITVESDSDSISLGTINTCNELAEYYYFMIDTVFSPMMGIDINISLDDQGSFSYSIDDIWNISDHYTEVDVKANDGIGDYIPSFMLVLPYNTAPASCSFNNCNNMTISFEELGTESGEIVKGTLNGILDSWDGLVEVSGAFKDTIQ